jgi:hypothetical protein
MEQSKDRWNTVRSEKGIAIAVDFFHFGKKGLGMVPSSSAVP